MQNKRSIPRKRTTLGSPATPRSARILDKKQWYVFFSNFLLFRKGRLTPSFWFLGNGCRTRGEFRGREKRWRFLQLRGVPGYWSKNNGMSLFSTFLLSRKGSQINFFWFLENGCRTRGVFRGGESRWGLLQLRGVPGY